MMSIKRLFLYRKRLVRPYIDTILNLLNSASIFVALLFIVTIIFEYGFIISHDEHAVIDVIYRSILTLFISNSLCQIIFDFKRVKSQYGLLAWLVTVMLYLTLLPAVFRVSEASNEFVVIIDRVFNSDLYQAAVLSALSILQISNGIVKVLNRRVNPSLIFSVSFLAIILLGAGLMMLPRSTYEPIAFIDALFISTSATCVTGLSTVDVATVFTPMGLTFIMILIQIGGLGVMTITSFFALFFMGNTSLGNQTLLSDMVSSKSLNSLLSTLIYIFGFTIAIEGAGAAAIFMDIHTTMGMSLEEEIAFSVFHSISAFCNAGFSTLTGNLGNEMLMNGGHNTFYLVISLLIILGGVGFPILVNLYDWAKYFIKRRHRQFFKHTYEAQRQVHIYDINTKIAVAMTIALIVIGTVVIGALEWNGAFANMSTIERFVQSLFTAVCPRTAGFASVSMGAFGMQTILLLIFLMVIGGGSQSTAGGIKVNAFAVIFLNIKAILQGNSRVTIFNRSLSADSIHRSNSTLIIYTLVIFVAVFTLSIFEPNAPLLSLLFESISALSTVGASLDLTPILGSESKVVIIILMFVGRVGVFTILASIIKQKRVCGVEYPSGNIIIN